MNIVREATKKDVGLILELVRELAEYERAPGAVQITEAELLRDGFPAPGSQRYFETVIAEHDGTPAGFALFHPVYSTWRGRAMHLEDLFVRPQFRGRGLGRALLEKVASIALDSGCVLLFWHVLDWNTPAVEFYKTLGAEPLDEWTRMRVHGDALRQLAAGVAGAAK
jgi:GNAT superfamily N-acetyltransferase